MKILGKLNNLFGKKFIAIVLGGLLIILLIAGSYAAWYWDDLGESNLISTESVEIEFLESDGEVINLEGAFPVIDSVGMAQEDTFDFQVKTNTRKDMDISYSLYIERIESDSGYYVLQDKDVKVYLTDFSNNVKVAPTKVSDLNNYVLYNEINSHGETSIEQIDKYKLRVWIDEDVTALDWDENTKLQYKFKIGVKVEKQKKLASTMLMSKVGESGLEKIVHEADDTLQIGATEDITEYRFRGGNDVVTNNYVYFNCSDINNQSVDTCELYRIIGVLPTEDGTGKIENRVKLIRVDSYSSAYWDKPNGGFGTNDWTKPATLNTLLNETYWNNISEEYQKLIGDAKYYLGGYNANPNIITNIMYKYERKISGNTYYYNNNPTNWTGKIALMYASDYGYAANSSCSENTELYSYNVSFCLENNWLYFGAYEWLLSHFSDDDFAVLYIDFIGFINYIEVDGSLGGTKRNYKTRQVFYLTADAQFNDIGDGSQDNPYQLKALG